MSLLRSQRAAKRDNPDFEESISDDDVDELSNVCPNDEVSLLATNKQELPLPVRLDFLKGICNQNIAGKGSVSSLSIEKEPIEDEVEMPDFMESNFGDISGEVVANSSDEETYYHHQKELIEDDVEMPDFKESEFGNILGEVVANSSDEETISKDKTGKQYGPQFIRKEQVRDTTKKWKAFLRSKKHAPFSASHSISSKANTTDGNYFEDDGRMEIKSETEPAETEALAHGLNLHSMTDLFDNLQDKTDLNFPLDCQRREKTMQLFQKSRRAHLLDTVYDNEDSPDPVNSGSSSDNEVNVQHMKITIPGKNAQTMADRFHEALGTSSVINEGTHAGALNSLRNGIFGQLQLVMQREKERDMDFWKKLQAGGEFGCVDVKIISRYLDGKLTVCCCSFSKYAENFVLQDKKKELGFGCSESSQRTVIFNPRVCNNVDLEVGNLIRIYPPWKEVQVENDNIILCTYFSEISSPV